MGAEIWLIDWCLDRKDDHNRISQLEYKLLDYEEKIEEFTNNTANSCLYRMGCWNNPTNVSWLLFKKDKYINI